MFPSRLPPKAKELIPEWLDSWTFTRFVSLATNNTNLPYKKNYQTILRDRLREWDGRINHSILGKTWAKRHSDRIFAFYTLEKPNLNPHWHGLVRFFKVDGISFSEQEASFDSNAGPIWTKLVPSGSVVVRPITFQRGVAKYLAKELGYSLSYDSFVTPDEFVRG